jgi:putative transposase
VPRPPRVQFAGAVYHLMNRGVRGEELYTDVREHHHFLGLLAETCLRYGWLVRTYCLMGNHYHLLVTTPEPTLSVGMQWLNGCYAQWFNWRHRHKGHAFFRRFNSVLIETDSQLAEVARYILLNRCGRVSASEPRSGPGAATARCSARSRRPRSSAARRSESPGLVC